MPDQIEARAVAARVAARLGLPSPAAFIGDGLDAWVFSTTDPKWVVRVGDALEGSSNEEQLLDPDFAGGVVRVLRMEWEDDYVLTWKEKVTPSVERFIFRRLSDRNARRIAHALLGLWEYRPGRTKLLRKWKPTRGLGEAIEAGLPTSDLDLRSNLGVTSDGRIVAFDL
jgi:hypothetical protein